MVTLARLPRLNSHSSHQNKPAAGLLMSLRLRQAIPGRPNDGLKQGVDVLAVDGNGFVIYPSGPNVVVLGNDLELSDTLQFWAALPHRAASSSTSSVKGVCCIGKESLIIAWSDIHVVIWQYVISKGRGSWTVHSTMVASAAVSCADFIDGSLVLGTAEGMEFWRTDLKAEVIVWDRLWARPCSSPSRIHVSPEIGHVAWFREGQRSVQILALDRKGLANGVSQELRHPREIEWISWRKAKTQSGDAYLYTITSNSVLRVYSPVLDDPTWFQLLSSSDHRAFVINGSGKKGKEMDQARGAIWVLDADVVRQTLTAEMGRVKEGPKKPSVEIQQALEGLESGEYDLVAWVGKDGRFVLRSIVNMDRRPPTLLKSLPIASTLLLNAVPWSPYAHLLPASSSTRALAVLPPRSSGHIAVCDIDFTDLLSSSASAVIARPSLADPNETVSIHLSQPIDHFVRTPNGRGLLAVGEDGESSAWQKEKRGKMSKTQRLGKALLGKGLWNAKHKPHRAAVFAKGRAMVFCDCGDSGEAKIILRHLDEGSTQPTEGITLHHFERDAGDDVEMLLAVSDIDDGHSGKGRRTQRAFVMAVTRHGQAWVWLVESRWATEPGETERGDIPTITLVSQHRLPVDIGDGTSDRPLHILPVDPMGWHTSVIDWTTNTPLQDMVLTISEEGVLEFWTPQLGHHYAFESGHANGHTAGDHCSNGDMLHGDLPWSRSGVVHTDKRNVIMARCSSRKKTALVTCSSDTYEITIWDSNVSEFSTGLELIHTFEPGEVIQDLDWTTTTDLQSVLAVGFAHQVVLVCEQRMSYVESNPGWAPFLIVNMEQYTTVPINDSIWLAGGSLAVGAGNQIYLFSRFLERDTPTPSPSASAKSVAFDDEPEDIFQLIASQNGPLWDYHPTVLAQCLLWNKLDLVKRILRDLVQSFKDSQQKGRRRLAFKRLEPIEFFSKRIVATAARSARKYDGLFGNDVNDVDDEDPFNLSLVNKLHDYLNESMIMPLSRAEKSMLATIAQATLEVEQQRRSLDISGLRYLISIRIFFNQTQRPSLSGTATPITDTHVTTETSLHGARLSFRNIVWATHSESQEMLLTAATECCLNGKMLWEDAKRYGVFLWLQSTDAIKAQLEVVARNRFMVDENRDPTACSLIFFALGKKKVLHGLWRQAYTHKEQQMMLKFLANDFELDRWKTAAIKNAYALLSKQRYEYAAAFFMLAGNAKDAINVCLRQLEDWQLAIALARVVEGGTDGPLMRWILSDTVIPLAFAGGHRWLATWAFWMLGRRDLAVRVLLSPLAEVAAAWSPEEDVEVGNPENDDPSLLLLFRHLKSKSLQTAKGTSEIPQRTEFGFVLHNARVFFRMGCHSLALDLLRSWSFDRPFFPPPTKRIVSAIVTPSVKSSESPTPVRSSLDSTASFVRPRRPSFMLSNHNRRESMFMDIDVLAEKSEPVSRLPTPPRSESPVFTEEIDEKTANGSEVKQVEKIENEPRKVGNLMKDLKQDVQQGAMEFDMDSFF
ncbi:RAVE protein 1 C terminal-domain-containing protein [Naematelia encephala]|uniref:RAVE protein 1 C terminal-domain-containing protein n=1 Tax=Naematelia encephala TaxID=71784 RepID=A0A1Y2AT84_9TREE|nr:RAVE protein 1 C terminal-domain-containing protein [Naematelia encephala]